MRIRRLPGRLFRQWLFGRLLRSFYGARRLSGRLLLLSDFAKDEMVREELRKLFCVEATFP